MSNIDALTDLGRAKDYVHLQWMLLLQDDPGDFIIATWRAIQRPQVHRVERARTGHCPAL